MTAPTFAVEAFDAPRAAMGWLFCEKIEEDPWVIFHGTSETNSAAIEDVGFAYTRDKVTALDVDRVISIFETMRWCGVDTGGYAVLSAFSATDFIDDTTSFLFFTETSTRALLYASRGYAGGERVRGIRKAIADLRAYLGLRVHGHFGTDARRSFAHAAQAETWFIGLLRTSGLEANTVVVNQEL